MWLQWQARIGIEPADARMSNGSSRLTVKPLYARIIDLYEMNDSSWRTRRASPPRARMPEEAAR
jgi:hypothetical protein